MKYVALVVLLVAIAGCANNATLPTLSSTPTQAEFAACADSCCSTDIYALSHLHPLSDLHASTYRCVIIGHDIFMAAEPPSRIFH